MAQRVFERMAMLKSEKIEGVATEYLFKPKSIIRAYRKEIEC